MELKLSNKILSIHDGIIESEKIINNFTSNAYLSNILLDLDKNLSVNKVTFLYNKKLLCPKGYKSYIVEIDNVKLIAAYKGQGFFPQSQINELTKIDPDSFPTRKLEIKIVKIDIEQLFEIALNEPPYFVISELENLTNIDASLFVQKGQILWRFLCENRRLGFRTIHINALSGSIVFNKLDKINN
jgi:hypothetical protein